MIDAALASRLEQLEQDRFQLVRQAAGHRLRAFNTMEALAPQAAKVDMAIGVFRYLREHWVLGGSLLAIAGYALRRRMGLPGLAQIALRLGSYYLGR